MPFKPFEKSSKTKDTKSVAAKSDKKAPAFDPKQFGKKAPPMKKKC
jgi:hypothetical protein